MTNITAFYFDGKTSRKFNVTITISDNIINIAGDVYRNCYIDQIKISERAQNSTRKIIFSDGAHLEIIDNVAFNQLLKTLNYHDPLITRIQQNWRAIFLASIATIVIIIFSYIYILPVLSSAIAKALPEKIEQTIGKNTLSFLDQQSLAPSRLPVAQRDTIVTHFALLSASQKDAPAYEILFRKSNIGPNAFALSSGKIVLTDEIVTLANNNDAIMGVLAHELGHVHERHLMQQIVQSSFIGMATILLYGDVSGIVTAIPTVMLNLKYSRDAENAADDYAVKLLTANHISTLPFANLFKKLDAATSNTVPYFSTHPATDRRIKHIQDAQKKSTLNGLAQ